MAVLKLSHIYKRYDNVSGSLFKKKEHNDFAVNDLSFECRDGEFLGILGPSGCGKSTTLRMIAGLEKITDGDIFIGNALINDFLPKDRNIGLAFEDYALYPPLSVYDNLAFNLRAKQVPQEEVKEAVNRIAELMKVDDLLQTKPLSLSGGQKQRVNIARALVRRPSLLLLDEPLSHLDGKMRQELRYEIKRMHHEIHCTTIIVTHDQMEAMSLSDRILIMDMGKLQQIGTPLEVYDDPVNVFVASFIGEPPMNLMNSCIHKVDGGYVFTFDGSDVQIPVPTNYNSILSENMMVILGVRPVDVLINHKIRQGLGTPIPVAIYEDLGDECRVSVRIGDNLLNLTSTDSIYYERGELVSLTFNAEKTHLFDINTGERIRALK